MNVTIESQDQTTTVTAQGRLDFEAAGPFQKDVEATIAAAASADHAVVVDCAGLEYVSSAGLRVFLIGARAAKSANVPFAVYALTSAVKEIFDISGFGRIIDVLADRPAALAKVGRGA